MKITTMYVSRKTYTNLIKNTIKRIMEEHKVCEDTAVFVLYMSDLFRQFRFVIGD